VRVLPPDVLLSPSVPVHLCAALAGVSDDASPERAALMIELAVDAFYVTDYEGMRSWASRARDAAAAVGDHPLSAAAAGVAAWAVRSWATRRRPDATAPKLPR